MFGLLFRILPISKLKPNSNDKYSNPVISYVKIRDHYYIAGDVANEYASKLINARDVNGVLNTYLWYNQITTGRNEVSCK